MATIEELSKISSQVRRDIVRMVTAAKSGHPGGSLGITDVMTTLYFNEMKHDPKTWTRSAVPSPRPTHWPASWNGWG